MKEYNKWIDDSSEEIGKSLIARVGQVVIQKFDTNYSIGVKIPGESSSVTVSSKEMETIHRLLSEVIETPTVKEENPYCKCGRCLACDGCHFMKVNCTCQPVTPPSNEPPKEPARKLPSERIRELGGIKHHFMLDGFEGNTELKVINHAIDELSRRVKGVIEYLNETQ